MGKYLSNVLYVLQVKYNNDSEVTVVTNCTLKTIGKIKILNMAQADVSTLATKTIPAAKYEFCSCVYESINNIPIIISINGAGTIKFYNKYGYITSNGTVSGSLWYIAK